MTTRRGKAKKPLLIKVGRHFINPSDIRCITQVKKNLYVVKFFSEPNPEWPCWVNSKDITILLEHFDVVVAEREDDDPQNMINEETIRWDR